MTFFWIIFFLLLGLGVLVKGADIFVDGSAGIARRLRVSDFFIGITLVAMGTSLPEFIVSLFAGFSNSSQLAVGNIIGSNIANIALILGLCGLIKAVRIQPDTIIKRDIPFIILSGFVLFVLGFDQFFQNNHVTFNRLNLGDGLILLAFFTIFLFYVVGNLKSGQALAAEMEKKEKFYGREGTFQLWAKIVLGLLAVIGGGKLVVDNATALAGLLGVSQGAIGLTIVAIGTSLPEAVISIVAIMKKKQEIAVGNIIGSNTLNIFFILGFVSTLTPLDLSIDMMTDIAILIAISLFLFFAAHFRKELGKYAGLTLLASYSCYILFVALRETALL